MNHETTAQLALEAWDISTRYYQPLPRQQRDVALEHDRLEEIVELIQHQTEALPLAPGYMFGLPEADGFGAYLYCGHDERGVKIAVSPTESYNPLAHAIGDDGYMSYEDFRRYANIDLRPKSFVKLLKKAPKTPPAAAPTEVSEVWPFLGDEAKAVLHLVFGAQRR